MRRLNHCVHEFSTYFFHRILTFPGSCRSLYTVSIFGFLLIVLINVPQVMNLCINIVIFLVFSDMNCFYFRVWFLWK